MLLLFFNWEKELEIGLIDWIAWGYFTFTFLNPKPSWSPLGSQSLSICLPCAWPGSVYTSHWFFHALLEVIPRNRAKVSPELHWFDPNKPTTAVTNYFSCLREVSASMVIPKPRESLRNWLLPTLLSTFPCGPVDLPCLMLKITRLRAQTEYCHDDSQTWSTAGVTLPPLQIQ